MGSSLAGARLKHAVSCALSHGPLSHETLPRVAAFTAEPDGESPISRAFLATILIFPRRFEGGEAPCLSHGRETVRRPPTRNRTRSGPSFRLGSDWEAGL